MTSRKSVPPLSLQTRSAADSQNSLDSSGSQSSEGSRVATAPYVSSRPLTVTIPRGYNAQGPYNPRRPNLSEILANTAPPPWTLSAFMAYLSQNHCLETLEFTMDASRYTKHYSKMIGRAASISPFSEECTYVKMLWQRLLDAYIVPNGPREVNLPSDVRDNLLSLSNPNAPPHPSTLEPAVAKIYELMEESVLVPFLNSLCPQSAAGQGYGDDTLHSHTRSYDERAFYRGHGQSPSMSVSQSANPYQHRASAPSSLSNSFSFSRSRFTSSGANPSSRPAPSSSYSSSNNSLGNNDLLMTDDSGSPASVSSPSALSDPMTPPTTPPLSEYGFGEGASSPRSSRGDTGMGNWGKMAKRAGSKFGWKKGRREERELAEEGAMP